MCLNLEHTKNSNRWKKFPQRRKIEFDTATLFQKTPRSFELVSGGIVRSWISQTLVLFICTSFPTKIKIRPNSERIPEYHHFKNTCKQVGKILDRIVGASDPEVLVDQVSDLSSAKGAIFFVSFHFHPDWFFFWSENYGWFCSVLKQSSHRVLQNLALKYLLLMTKILNHPLIQPPPLLCKASVGRCEQVHTWVCYLIFQQANEVGIGNLSKWRSEICSRWSAPWFFEESPPLKMTEFFGWRSRLASLVLILCLSLTFFYCGWVKRLFYSGTPWIQFLRIKRWRGRNWICKDFSRYTMCVPHAWRPFSAARRNERTSQHSFRRWMRWKRHKLTGNVGISTAYWISISKKLESFIQLISLSKSCILKMSSRIVSRSSINLFLEIVSNVEPWQSFNSSFADGLIVEFRVAQVRGLRPLVDGFILEDHCRSLWVVEDVKNIGLITCESCWRSLWSACRWGWFSIFWIKLWTLTPCDRFTVKFGTPGMCEVDVLLVGCTVELVVRVKWCNVTMFCRNKLFFHYVCAYAWFHRFRCSIVSMHDANVFRQFHRFPCSIWRAKFFVQTFIIDLLWTGRFSFIHKNSFCVLKFPRSITDWVGFGLGKPQINRN